MIDDRDILRLMKIIKDVCESLSIDRKEKLREKLMNHCKTHNMTSWRSG